MDTALLTIDEASQFLGIGRSFLYSRLLATGEIPTVRLGRAVRVPRASLVEYVARLTATSGGIHTAGRGADSSAATQA